MKAKTTLFVGIPLLLGAGLLTGRSLRGDEQTKAFATNSEVGALQPTAKAFAVDIRVKLRPVLEHIDVVTDINVVGNTLFVCTQPGRLYRMSLAANSAPSLFLDLRSAVGTLGSNVPGLPSLGYPTPGTYDERGLLSFAADPNFESNGRFWVWYSNINERSGSPPYFFQWLVST